MADCDKFVRIDDADDIHDGDDDDVDDEPPNSVELFNGINSDFKLSNSTLIDTPSPADSFSQMLAGDQMIAFEFDRFDFVDKFNGSSSSNSIANKWNYP